MEISLTPALRRFVERQVKSRRYKNAAEVIGAALQRMEAIEGLAASSGVPSALAGLSGSADIEALVFLVMMDAAKSAEEDLKAILAEVKAMTAAKAKLRELIGKVNRDVAANAGCQTEGRKLDFTRGMGSEEAYHRAPMPVLDPDADNGVRLKPCELHPGKIANLEVLRAIFDGLKGQLDSMNELSEMTSLRLQMMMDRRSKFIETLSNIMKKISTTQETVTQNLK